MTSFLEQVRAYFFQQTGDLAGSQQMALKALELGAGGPSVIDETLDSGGEPCQ